MIVCETCGGEGYVPGIRRWNSPYWDEYRCRGCGGDGVQRCTWGSICDEVAVKRIDDDHLCADCLKQYEAEVGEDEAREAA